MALELYGHPLSSYYQKALIAFYETDTPFTLRILDPDHADHLANFYAIWPVGKFPLLVDGDRLISESSIIIEHVAPGLIPAEPEAALEARMMDRIFDNYVMTPMQKFSADALRPENGKDPMGVADAHAMLDRAYEWINTRLSDRDWAAGADFTVADCAAAPALFYADWAHPISESCVNLREYLARLQARPSVARAALEAEPYLHMVPLPPRTTRVGA